MTSSLSIHVYYIPHSTIYTWSHCTYIDGTMTEPLIHECTHGLMYVHTHTHTHAHTHAHTHTHTHTHTCTQLSTVLYANVVKIKRNF